MNRVFIDVAEADALLRGMVKPFPAESISLWEAEGRVLREPVKADAAYPPFDRVCMDGFALQYETLEKGRRDFWVSGYAPAGKEPASLNDPNACVEVMTGAALPSNCDCVIPVEHVKREGDRIHCKPDIDFRKRQHIHDRGRDYQTGDILLDEGLRLSGPQLAVAAAVGYNRLTVSKRPRIMLVLTGDELVPIDTKPEGAQIRMTHPYALQGLLRPWADLSWTHARDNTKDLLNAIGKALSEADVVLITGGVSAGRHDLVPETLAALGASPIFHKVRQRPGKPFWVGESKEGKCVFAFPGNPVAATMCARRYLLPWLWRCLEMNEPVSLKLPVAETMKGLENLTVFPAMQRRNRPDGSWELHPCRVQGSGDFSGLSVSHGFVEIPAGRTIVEAGELLSYYDWSFV